MMQVFISHGFTNAKLAGKIADALREAGFQVWDPNDMFPGDNWGTKVGEALDQSDAMVVVLTADSVRSPLFGREVEYALGKKEYKGRLVSVVAEPPEKLAKEKIPWVLFKFPMVNLRGRGRDKNGLQELVQVLRKAE